MKRIISMMLAFAVIIGLVITTHAAKTSDQEENKSIYTTISGVVKEVNVSGTGENSVANVSITESNGNPAHIIITQSAYSILGNTIGDIKKGDEIIGVYDTSRPMITIYPPQYNVVAYAVNLPDSQTIKVDFFNDNLVSSDNTLKLILDDKVKIYSQTGDIYKDSIKNKNLIVLYSASTRSIPAQTVPDKIVVLSDAVTPDYTKVFDEVSGTISKIQKVYDKNKKEVKLQRLLTIKNNDGTSSKILINKNTCFVSGKLSTLKVNQRFIGYYVVSESTAKQHTAVAAAANLKEGILKVDRFDENLLSGDGSLVLHLSKQTKIVTPDGKAYKGSLNNKVLAVVYSIVQESYPGQTTPSKIIVLAVK